MPLVHLSWVHHTVTTSTSAVSTNSRRPFSVPPAVTEVTELSKEAGIGSSLISSTDVLTPFGFPVGVVCKISHYLQELPWAVGCKFGRNPQDFLSRHLPLSPRVQSGAWYYMGDLVQLEAPFA